MNVRVRQGLALHELQDEKAPAIRFLQTVDRCDIRMVQGGEQVRLALEPGQALLVGGEVLGQDLDGNVALQVRITGPIHLTHAARTERFKDLVMTEGFPNQDDGSLSGVRVV